MATLSVPGAATPGFAERNHSKPVEGIWILLAAHSCLGLGSPASGALSPGRAGMRRRPGTHFHCDSDFFPRLGPILVIGFPFCPSGCVTSGRSRHLGACFLISDSHRRHTRGIGGPHRSAPDELRGREGLGKEGGGVGADRRAIELNGSELIFLWVVVAAIPPCPLCPPAAQRAPQSHPDLDFPRGVEWPGFHPTDQES